MIEVRIINPILWEIRIDNQHWILMHRRGEDVYRAISQLLSVLVDQ